MFLLLLLDITIRLVQPIFVTMLCCCSCVVVGVIMYKLEVVAILVFVIFFLSLMFLFLFVITNFQIFVSLGNALKQNQYVKVESLLLLTMLIFSEVVGVFGVVIHTAAVGLVNFAADPMGVLFKHIIPSRMLLWFSYSLLHL